MLAPPAQRVTRTWPNASGELHGLLQHTGKPVSDDLGATIAVDVFAVLQTLLHAVARAENDSR